MEPNEQDRPSPLHLDPDFELLESYLDAELTPGEVSRVENRLQAEPDLAAALGRMNAEYAARRAAWTSMEPDDAVASKIAGSAVRLARRAELQRRFTRVVRFGGAIAACIALSFVAGWVGRGYASAPVASARDASHFLPANSGSTPESAYVYEVALTDEAGNITAIQKFEQLDDAKSFAADVGRWQARQQQIQEGRVILMSSRL